MKTMYRLFLLLLVGMLVLSACGGGDSETNEPAAGEENGDAAEEAALVGDAVAGETLFAGTCVSCHGVGGTGLPGLGKDMTTSEFIASQTDAELIEFIKMGRPTGDPLNTTGVDMPPKGGNPALDDQDIADIVAYIRTIHE